MKNRYMHVDYKPEMENDKIQSASDESSKGKNCTLKCTCYIMRVNGKRNGAWEVMVDIID